VLSQLRIKNAQHIVFNLKWICSFKKIVLRIFYIEYFSAFAGDFAPIVVRNAWVACCVGWNGLLVVDGLIENQTGRCHNVVL
jgi:hypothetical protein